MRSNRPSAAPAAPPDPTTPTSRTWGSRAALVLLLAALTVQLWSVYAPDAPAQPTFAGEDKLAHALLFGVPVALAWAARLRRRLVTALVAVHAPVSELVQHYLLPHRSGDVWDALADLVGLLVGLVGGRVLARVVGRSATRW